MNSGYRSWLRPQPVFHIQSRNAGKLPNIVGNHGQTVLQREPISFSLQSGVRKSGESASLTFFLLWLRMACSEVDGRIISDANPVRSWLWDNSSTDVADTPSKEVREMDEF